ncbi:hypothetical protein PQR63_23365 [Herbaspirillum rhizosphaerae]|uniref:Tyr recombinase domain-containing protein n=1 Tax=Herbaspirillum rhizosphaerae TaxID=346179 RepID=A0ABW8ZGR8_9BURK
MLYLIFWPILQQERPGLLPEKPVPVIFDENWVYQRPASRYLRARARGEAFGEDQRTRIPTKQSLETFARYLCNFLEWCAWARHPWGDVEYLDHLINGYQRHMESGIFSAEKRPLAANTINRRVDEACHFLSWAGRAGLRRHFKISARAGSMALGGMSSNRRTVEFNSRIGKVRPNPSALRIPTEEQVARWLRGVKIEKGLVKALMCELIIKSAIRREECAQWRIDTLPLDRNSWDVYGEKLTLSIEHGTKGSKRLGELKEEIGPRRHIVIPLELAESIHHYREFLRPKIRMKYVNAAINSNERRRRLKQVENRLFLSEHTGLPLTGKQLWKDWTEVKNKPYSGWSPHLGRHYWSCHTLLKLHRERENLLATGCAITSDWIVGNAQSDLLMVVQPQLGHIDVQTTNVYLRWLQKMALGIKHADDWMNNLEDLPSDAGGEHG